MNVLFPTLALLAGSLTARAQQPPAEAPRMRLGVKAGVNVASYSSPGTRAADNRRLGPLAGVLANLPLTARLSVQPEVLYSLKGNKSATVYLAPGAQFAQRATLTEALHYLDVPLLLRGRLGRVLVLEGGVQGSWLLDASSTLEAGSISLEADTRGQYQGFDAGYVLGIGALVQPQLQVGFRYHGSLTNSRTFGTRYNEVVQFQAAYLFLLDRRSPY